MKQTMTLLYFRNQKLRLIETENWIFRLILILLVMFSGNLTYGQVFCNDFTITGSTTNSYWTPSNTTCITSPTPSGTLPYTGWSTTGFIKHTFNAPQTCVTIVYTAVNSNVIDLGLISIDGGGVMSLEGNGCVNVNGNTIGPYTGPGPAGDVEVTVYSTQSFTEVTLTNVGGQNGFISGDCNSVTIHTPPADLLGNDTVWCGNQVVLDATYPGTNAYEWQDQSNFSAYGVNAAGIYFVDVTYHGVCHFSDTVEVIESLAEIDAGEDQIICEGEEVTLSAIGVGQISWDQNVQNGVPFNPPLTQDYVATLQTPDNCIGTDTVTVFVNPAPTAQFIVPANGSIPPGQTILFQNSSVGANSYSWDFGDGNNSSFENPEHSYSEVGVYEVELIAVSPELCSDTITLPLRIRGETFIYIPNGFTPDGDGKNDYFLPVFSEEFISNYSLTIYNRWGELVFQSLDMNLPWDGKSKGVKCKSDVYVWHLKYGNPESVALDLVEYRGHVNLLR